MIAMRVALAALCGLWLVDATAWPDCDKVDMEGNGPYGEQTWFNDTAADGTVVFIFHPTLTGGPSSFPVMVFSHGSIGEYAMYVHAIARYVSHGFVVVFPHIKSPTKDTSPLTLDPMGGFTMKGVAYASMANANASNPLKGMLQLENLILAGHSMGASSTIMASKKLPAGTVKATIAQHPGICGPFGPPPCLGPGALCNTWMPQDFKDVSRDHPMVLTTATNDGAFWPAPYTAEHEYGCYNQSLDSATKGTIFAQWSADVCQDDGTGGRFGRKWSTGGHDCPMRVHSVETPWVLAAAKLYGQLGGDSSSSCHAMLWGVGPDSLSKFKGAEHFEINVAKAPESVVV